MGNLLSNLKVKNNKKNNKIRRKKVDDDKNNRYKRDKQEFLFIEDKKFYDENNLKYPLSSSDSVINRTQVSHYLTKNVWDGNFSSPVEAKLKQRGSKVLDVGCGPGIWSLDIAHTFLDCEITGIDILTTYPSEIKPSNVNFSKINVLQGLPYPNNHFDFIYQRFLDVELAEIQIEEILISELFRVLKPGGWIEIMEIEIGLDVMPTLGSVQKKLLGGMYKFFESHGTITGIDAYQKVFEKHIGLIDVTIEKRECPIGKWGGKLGEACVEQFLHGLNALKIPLMQTLNYTDQEFEETLRDYVKETDYTFNYWTTFRIYARKK